MAKVKPRYRLLFLCLTLYAVTASAQSSSSSREPDPLHQFNGAVRKLVKQVTPRVVQVLASGYGPVQNAGGNTSVVVGMQQKVGSGVIVDPDGYIVTNAHVVRGAQHVRISLPTVVENESGEEPIVTRSRMIEAVVVGADDDIDLAVLKIDATSLPAIHFSDYNKLRQGDVVLAFGSPEGLQDSVTMGVVSAVARQIDSDSPIVFVQTDAATNPGNSGGPLVNVDGELVGINTFILSESGGNEGLGFAIPSAVVAYAYPQLRKYGHLRRGETGIGVQAITPELAAGLKLAVDSGVIISDVLPGSPADSAGVKALDVIRSVDGHPVNNLPSLGTRLLMKNGGEQVKLGVLRGAIKLTFAVPIVEMPNDLDAVAKLLHSEERPITQLGVIAIDIDSRVANKLGDLRIASGVLVAAREAASTADVLLQTGDIIHTINGAAVKTIEEIRSALNRISPNTPVVLQIERSGKLMFVAFRLADRE